jgi:hypothetical protein
MARKKKIPQILLVIMSLALARMAAAKQIEKLIYIVHYSSALAKEKCVKSC